MAEQRISGDLLAVIIDRFERGLLNEPNAMGHAALDLRDCRVALASTEGERDTLARIVDRLLDGFTVDVFNRRWVYRTIYAYTDASMSDDEVAVITEREVGSDG